MSEDEQRVLFDHDRGARPLRPEEIEEEWERVNRAISYALWEDVPWGDEGPDEPAEAIA